ncbi:hypothetical protein KDL29_06895 [bacterium]|nr:hypothetical protein [bacterium]
MLTAIIIIVGTALAAYLMFSRTLRRSTDWKATVTPLASIMGSGFLVSAPLLAGSVGNFSLPSMAGLLLLAYLVGSAIRFNIRHFEPIENKGRGAAQDVGWLSRVVLAGAYFITVSYYLQLLAAFVLNALGTHSQLLARCISTGILLFILVIGVWKGLELFEGLERYTTALNLAMIGALLAGLAVHNISLATTGQWSMPQLNTAIGMHDLQVLLGMLIIVQGFETSRYLGDEHPAEQRIRTMRNAQLISSVIYLLFIGLVTVLFHSGLGSDVTAIIGMVQPVSVVLPALILVTAIGSQFSAAVADNAGAGGLVEELSLGRLPQRYAYLLISVVTITLTWLTNVNAIIAYASRAFAVYYTLQCLVALLVAAGDGKITGRHWRIALYGALALACAAVAVLSIPAG